LLVTVLVV